MITAEEIRKYCELSYKIHEDDEFLEFVCDFYRVKNDGKLDVRDLPSYIEEIELDDDGQDMNVYGESYSMCGGPEAYNIKIPLSYLSDEKWREDLRARVKKEEEERERKRAEEDAERKKAEEKAEYERYVSLKKKFEQS